MDAKTSEPDVGQLKGRQLSSVEFVQDYVQLHFDGPTLTAVTQPLVRRGSRWYRWGEQGYRDALCENIGKTVGDVLLEEQKELRMEFEEGDIVVVSLRSGDYRAGDAMWFTDRPGGPASFW